jgi:hypothetical protein
VDDSFRKTLAEVAKTAGERGNFFRLSRSRRGLQLDIFYTAQLKVARKRINAYNFFCFLRYVSLLTTSNG